LLRCIDRNLVGARLAGEGVLEIAFASKLCSYKLGLIQL
jgi:hypothetical protein